MSQCEYCKNESSELTEIMMDGTGDVYVLDVCPKCRDRFTGDYLPPDVVDEIFGSKLTKPDVRDIPKPEYKIVKNYIHNELGISKGYIRELITSIIREEIQKLLKDETFVTDVIKSKVSQVMYSEAAHKRGGGKSIWMRSFDLEDSINSIIQYEASRVVRERLKLILVEEPSETTK